MNKVLFLSFIFLSSLSLFSQTWVELNEPPFFKHHSNGFGYGDKAYVFEGTNNESISNEFWEYNSLTDTWVQLEDFPGEGRTLAIGDDWNDKYYYGFGSGANGGLNDLWEFDPATMAFTQLPSCPCEGRGHPSLIAHNDKVSVGAGSGDNGDVKDWWEYDMLTQEWIQGPDIPGGDRHHTFHFALDDSYFIGGGHVANWNKYNRTNREWTPISAVPQGRVAGTQFNHAGYGYILGGDDARHRNISIEESFMRFDPEPGVWELLPNLPNGSRWAPSSFIINDEVYFFGGLSDSVVGDGTMWKFDLALLNCLPPSSLNAVNVDDKSAGLFWASSRESISDSLRWRKVGEQEWNIILDAKAVVDLAALEACQDYEFAVSTECSGFTSESEVFTFRTDGCCVSPEITINDIENNSAQLEWPAILAAKDYDLRWKDVEATEWETSSSATGTFELTNLSGCTEYEVQIKSICDIAEIAFGPSVFFVTRDCGICLDHEYCNVPVLVDEELPFIKSVRINDYVNISDGSRTYQNFAVPSAESLLLGDRFELAILPEFSNDLFPLNLKAWIDYNANGVFESNELIVDQVSVEREYNVSVLVPATASVGLTRMRISYSFETNPCIDQSFFFGEIEDYCVFLTETSNTENVAESQEIIVYPNPFENFIKVQGKFGPIKESNLKIVDLLGETMYEIENYGIDKEVVLPAAIPAGIYFLIIENEAVYLSQRIVKQ